MPRTLAWTVLALSVATGMLAAPAVEHARIGLSQPQGSHMTTPRIPDRASFVSTVDGKATDLYLLKNAQDTTLAITNYGARVVSLLVRGREGRMVDVILGFDSLQGYLSAAEQYFGATIGRYANRIARGRFVLDGATYQLATNNAPNHLHGGPGGFHAVVWEAQSLGGGSVRLRYRSPDMDEGYPGALDAIVTYTLTPANELRIDYEATTTNRTVVNLTNHAFFNLNGEGRGPINDHVLMIAADRYTPVDQTLIPKGTFEPVENTPLDFRSPTVIGARVDADAEQLRFGRGYDHNFVLRPARPGEVRQAATVHAPQTGVFMEVLTDQPGLQFYGGNFLAGKDRGKSGRTYEFRSAFCLETQHFPDSPNHPAFPSVALSPGEVYRTTSVYRFSAR